ncbi:MAG TPA: sigma-70 family RNA polymerase sigma factor [Terriglobales bacterium]|nr:sigma-70 family RNA polymerase sigma factor [Terriglobales bacterium]
MGPVSSGKASEGPLRTEALVIKHLPLVRTIAQRLYRGLPSQADLDDLIGEGVLGLLDAARKFDPGKGAAFGSYARHRIQGAMTDSLRRLDPVSRDMRKRQRCAERLHADLHAKLGRPPQEGEMAGCLKLPLPRWRVLARELHYAGCPVNGHGFVQKPATPVENLHSPVPDPEHLAARTELRQVLTAAIRTLPLRWQRVMALYYGQEWTMNDIARELQVNESRVSQIHTKAIQRMRAHLGSELRGQR